MSIRTYHRSTQKEGGEQGAKWNKYGFDAQAAARGGKAGGSGVSGTVTALCQACGVPRTTFYRWMADPTFLQYLEGLIERYTDGALAEVWKALVRECKRGSVPAMRLFFELKGRFKGEREAPPDKPVIIDDIGSQ